MNPYYFFIVPVVLSLFATGLSLGVYVQEGESLDQEEAKDLFVELVEFNPHLFPQSTEYDDTEILDLMRENNAEILADFEFVKKEILKNRDLIAVIQTGPSSPVEPDPDVRRDSIPIEFDEEYYEQGDIVTIKGNAEASGQVNSKIKLPDGSTRTPVTSVDSAGLFYLFVVLKTDDPVGIWEVTLTDSAGAMTETEFEVR